MGIVWRGSVVRTGSWFDLFHGRPVASGRWMFRTVDVPGLGKTLVVRSVDCLGAMCPRPQLLTLKVLGEVGPGEVVEIVLDNPTAVEGFPALAETLGCAHLATVRDFGCWRVYLRKGS
jgi:tRNA 2-thiouridine synthesizing protein A